MLFATLQEKRRLFRKFNVVTPEGIFEVAYDGIGMGHELVLVEGEIVILLQKICIRVKPGLSPY